MRDHIKERIAAAAEALAGKAHTAEDLEAALFQLALDIMSPAGRETPCTLRRQPRANEVLPRHQRASWARGKTAHDSAED